MQERPNKLVLLTALARFLVEEVRPALSDPRLAFRALIAANLASVVASELASDDGAVTRDLDRLRPLLPEVGELADDSFESRRARVAELSDRLAARLRDDDLSPEEAARVATALRDSLREKLAIDNPRFDTSLDIE
jgi:hypothetical protein